MGSDGLLRWGASLMSGERDSLIVAFCKLTTAAAAAPKLRRIPAGSPFSSYTREGWHRALSSQSRSSGPWALWRYVSPPTLSRFCTIRVHRYIGAAPSV